MFFTHHFPAAWKHARVISTLKPRKDPAVPSTYGPISLLDTIDKLFENTLLARILHELSVLGPMRDEQFEFRPKHSTSLQLARFVERITKKFCERRITGAVFLDVAKAFGTVWIDALLYKLTLLNFLSYLVHKSHRTSGVVCSKRPSRWPRHLVEACGLGCLRVVYLPCPLQPVCQRHVLTLTPCRVSPLRGWHGLHSHVPQADAAHQLTGVIPQLPVTVVERMENRH